MISCPTDVERGHGTSFGRWVVAECDRRRALKRVCKFVLASCAKTRAYPPSTQWPQDEMLGQTRSSAHSLNEVWSPKTDEKKYRHCKSVRFGGLVCYAALLQQ